MSSFRDLRATIAPMHQVEVYENFVWNGFPAALPIIHLYHSVKAQTIFQYHYLSGVERAHSIHLQHVSHELRIFLCCQVAEILRFAVSRSVFSCAVFGFYSGVALLDDGIPDSSSPIQRVVSDGMSIQNFHEVSVVRVGVCPNHVFFEVHRRYARCSPISSSVSTRMLGRTKRFR